MSLINPDLILNDVTQNGSQMYVARSINSSFNLEIGERVRDSPSRIFVILRDDEKKKVIWGSAFGIKLSRACFDL